MNVDIGTIKSINSGYFGGKNTFLGEMTPCKNSKNDKGVALGKENSPMSGFFGGQNNFFTATINLDSDKANFSPTKNNLTDMCPFFFTQLQKQTSDSIHKHIDSTF